MELIIGAKFKGHDSSCFCYLPAKDDYFAMSLERLTRYKHDTLFPIAVIEKALNYFGITANEVTVVNFANGFLCQDKEIVGAFDLEINLEKRKLLGATYIKEYKQRMTSTINKMKISISPKIRYLSYKNSLVTQKEATVLLLKKVFKNASIKYKSFDHEYCHAVSSYFDSMYEEALCITMDGHGDNNVYSSVYFAKQGKLHFLGCSKSEKRLFNFSNNYSIECSIGGLYSYFTDILGFTPNADEGKVEALAAYGSKISVLYDFLCQSIWIDMIEYPQIIININEIEKNFSKDNMNRYLNLYKKEDLSATIQSFLEYIVMNYIKSWITKTEIYKLCLSGGVFANVILNQKIFLELTNHISIVPAMTDEGVAQGAAYLLMQEKRHPIKRYAVPYLGSMYTKDQVRTVLVEHQKVIEYKELGNNTFSKAAELICQGQIGAIFHGRMEWGPRALGNRSIIADVRDPNATKRMNLEIKKRPEFQPFCPSILEEEKERLFEKAYLNKHMTCAFTMKEKYRKILPSSVHIDGTARVQFVTKYDNEDFYRLLKKVKQLTGYGVVINTSFNKHGRTICESPKDAIRDFLDTDLDFLMIEGFYVQRKS